MPDLAGVGPIIRSFAGPEFVKSADTTADEGVADAVLRVDGVSKTYQQRKGLRVERTDAVRDVELHPAARPA